MTKIPGLTYEKERTVKKQKIFVELPVYSSDHFGVLVTLGPCAP